MLCVQVTVIDVTELGRRFRIQRIEERREWFADCAERLGVSLAELGALERGECSADWLAEHPAVARECGL